MYEHLCTQRQIDRNTYISFVQLLFTNFFNSIEHTYL